MDESNEIAPGIVARHGKPYLKSSDVSVIGVLRELANGTRLDSLLTKLGIDPEAIKNAVAYALEIMDDEVEVNKTSAWRSGEVLELAPGIVANKDIRFGRATIAGTRMDVLTVLREFAQGCDVQQFATAWGYEPEQISNVLTYAANVVDRETVLAASP